MHRRALQWSINSAQHFWTRSAASRKGLSFSAAVEFALWAQFSLHCHNLHTARRWKYHTNYAQPVAISPFSLPSNYPVLDETKAFDLLKPEIKIDFGLMHESSDTRSVESPIGAQSVIDVCSQSIQLLTLLVIS